MVKVAKGARIHDYIMKLPDGYETVLTEDGLNVSQGQKQLKTIARAMVFNRKMLILDGAAGGIL